MIEIKQLTKKYGSHIVFNQASYFFLNHGMTCILGASGCGKSTLLHLLAGFDCDYEGQIIVGNSELNQLSEEERCAYRRDHIGFIFQDYHLLHGFTVQENILLASKLYNLSEEDALKRMSLLLQQVGMSEKKHELVEKLSGGQKQRVAIVRALMGNPSIILADEVTGALDRENADEIMGILKDIAQEKLVIVITHDKKICTFADEVVTIKEGNILGSKHADTKCVLRKPIVTKPSIKISSWKMGLKNYKVHFLRYLFVSLAIAVGDFWFYLIFIFR